MSRSVVPIREVDVYTPELATEMRRLIPDLIADYNGYPDPADFLPEIIGSDRSAFFVAEASGRMVGTATLNLMIRPLKRVSYLDYLIVSEDQQFRGTGIGKRLFAAAMAWSLDQGATQMEWTSRNPESQKFYLRQGAELRDTGYFGIGL